MSAEPPRVPKPAGARGGGPARPLEGDATTEHDVLVIGLGPVGATAANIAGALGLRCLGVDASESVFGLPRAIHFDAEIMRIFQSIGLGEQIEAISRVTEGSVHLGADGEPIRDFRVPPERGQYGWYSHYLFYQPQLDQLLRDRAAARPGVETLLGWECAHVDQGVDGAIATLRHPSGAIHRARARHVIACDGASSRVRTTLGVELSDYGFEEPWLVVDLEVPSGDLGPNHMVAHCDPERPLTFIPGPGRHRRWEFMLLPGETTAEMSEPERALDLVGAAAPWLDVAASRLIRSAVYVFHGLVATTWSAGRVALAGDAVHQTPPFYGQGMCHGIRDVHNVLWKLAMVCRGRADSSLLDTYQREREPHVRAVIEAAVENGRYICVLDPGKARRRDAEYRERAAHGTDVRSWRGVIPGLASGLLDLPSSSPAVGGLFPQPRLRDDGGEWRLLDDVVGPRFAIVGVGDLPETSTTRFVDELRGAVVLVGAADETPPAWAHCVEADPGLLAAWFADHDCTWALVRPDRYVYGVASKPTELRDLVDALLVRLAPSEHSVVGSV